MSDVSVQVIRTHHHPIQIGLEDAETNEGITGLSAWQNLTVAEARDLSKELIEVADALDTLSYSNEESAGLPRPCAHDPIITNLRETEIDLRRQIIDLTDLLTRTVRERDDLKQIIDNYDHSFDPGRGNP